MIILLQTITILDDSKFEMIEKKWSLQDKALKKAGGMTYSIWTLDSEPADV